MDLSRSAAGTGTKPEDSSPGACAAVAVVDDSGRISLWSSQAEALLGYRAEEVCGTPAVALLSGPEDRKSAPTARERHSAEQDWNGVRNLRHRDGHTVRVALRVRPLQSREGRAGWSVSAADAQQVEGGEVDQAILHALFAQSPIAITVTDGELRHRWVNAATERFAGVPAERLIGRRIGEATPAVDAEAIERVLRRVRDTGEPVIDFRGRGRAPSDPDHERVWSGSSFRLTDHSGHLLGLCQTYVDITEGDRAQRRLALLTEAGAHTGTTLDVVHTAQELADAAVPEIADCG